MAGLVRKSPPRRRGLVAVADHRLALAIVAERRRLDHGRQPKAGNRFGKLRRRMHGGVGRGADAEPATKFFSIKPVLRDFQHLRSGSTGLRAARHRRGFRRHVLELVGDDIDRRARKLAAPRRPHIPRRSLSGVMKAGDSVSGEYTWQRKPSLPAASASMRPSWPPPRIPMVAPGFSSSQPFVPAKAGTQIFLLLSFWPWVPACEGTNGVCSGTSGNYLILRPLRDRLGLPRAPRIEPLGDLGIGQRQHAGRQQRGVDGAGLPMASVPTGMPAGICTIE